MNDITCVVMESHSFLYPFGGIFCGQGGQSHHHSFHVYIIEWWECRWDKLKRRTKLLSSIGGKETGNE